MKALRNWVLRQSDEEERRRKALEENAKACIRRLAETDHGRTRLTEIVEKTSVAVLRRREAGA